MSSGETLCSQMDLYQEFYKILGAKLKFKTFDGEYEGFLKLILPKRQRVTFEHVYYVPTREYMGNLHFSFRDFISYSVIESPQKTEKYEKFKYLTQILDRSVVANKYRVNDLFNGELEAQQSESEEYIPYSDEIYDDDFVLHLPNNFKGSLPVDSVILETCNTEFDQAVEYITHQSSIGVSFEGPKISRFGKLSWVCISTQDCIFLFDIELLGKSAFENGLKSIFEDKNIEKIIHDCRQPSDCLSHLFDTELVNVFDTQVADFIVNMQRYSDKPTFKYVSSLDCCLVNHLDVPQEFLYNRKKNLSYNDEVNFFKIRPISNDYRNVVIKNALYLLPLKEVLSDLLQSPFRKAVDVYLKVLTNASEPELLLEPSVPDMVPPALVLQGIQTVRFQDTPESTNVLLKCNFKDPKTGKTIGSRKPAEVVCDSTVNSVVDVDSCDEVISGKIITTDANTELSKHYKEHIKMKNVNIEKFCFPDSKPHIDKIFHHLASDMNQRSNPESMIDIKPSTGNLTSCVISKSDGLKQKSESKSVINGSKPGLDNSFETSSDCSSLDFNLDSSIDSESDDSWAKLRAAFGVSCFVPEKLEKDQQKIRFLPAGMYC